MRRLIYIATFLIVGVELLAQNATVSGYLTEDGAWCWFSDPRAIYVDGRVITGWVKSNGTVESASFDIRNQSIQTADLYFRLEKDDHNNPAFVRTSAGTVLAMYTRHSLKDLFINELYSNDNGFSIREPQLIHPISKKELKEFPHETITYANPLLLEEEGNRIYCFGRWTGFKPNMMWSDDNGSTWTKSRVFITNYPFDPGNRPYVKYYSDGKSRIHFVFTDGHPRVELTNSVYYAYYEKDKFYKSDGSLITDIENIPFEPGDASVIYKSNEEEGRAWIADIGQDNYGNPVVLYTKSPEETDHRYWYARFKGGEWLNYEICKSGKWFPQTQPGQKEREPHYFGNMTIHPDNANVVYLSRQINGTFEIERWETADYGKTWKHAAVTQNSEFDNVRPFVPRGLKAEDQEIVLWMENQKYIHYTDYRTSVKFRIIR
ncbi:MAG: BNR-4 repeat-containing protein [Cyclobacteriaceae bacterium]